MSRPWYEVPTHEDDSAALVALRGLSGTGSSPAEVGAEEEDVEGAEDDEEDECPSLVISFLGLDIV